MLKVDIYIEHFNVSQDAKTWTAILIYIQFIDFLKTEKNENTLIKKSEHHACTI